MGQWDHGVRHIVSEPSVVQKWSVGPAVGEYVESVLTALRDTDALRAEGCPGGADGVVFHDFFDVFWVD